ncbi:Protein MEMO1 [Microtus ochrogaster]|uniref:Protein MEMO1 n=1 Tax=Microtus ochrogaster TaxID=79684 RepID=A0A8J6GG02_MICOH|nr:Protein MEMO1 [Microtus ochrogaster]
MARGQQKIQSQQKNAIKQAGQKKKQEHDQKAAAKAALIYTCTVCRTQMPDPKTFKQHFESKHPKTPLPPELADAVAVRKQKQQQQQHQQQQEAGTLHAGYTYCGSCAAHAYKQVDPSVTRRIFILGPSHHVPLSRCALSSVDIYRTPLYDLRIDQKIYGELWKTGMFERMSLQTDEDEHSIEMHLPYTAKAMESHKDEFTIIPVLVGALSESKEQEFGKLFSKYLADPSNLFVVSSDFCHWGQRFRYSYYDESQGEIYRSIEHLDKMGMSIIEQLDPVSFSNYLKKYHNTICGRHPIGVLLNAITELQKNGMNMSFSFLNYAQSSQCRSWQDSSVSYAAGALTVH